MVDTLNNNNKKCLFLGAVRFDTTSYRDDPEVRLRKLFSTKGIVAYIKILRWKLGSWGDEYAAGVFVTFLTHTDAKFALESCLASVDEIKQEYGITWKKLTWVRSTNFKNRIEQVCRSFRLGRCTWGDSCRFLHINETYQISQDSENEDMESSSAEEVWEDPSSPVNAKPINSETLVFEAASQGNSKFITKYLDDGGDMWITNQFGLTLLHHAAGFGRVLCCRLLIERGIWPWIRSGCSTVLDEGLSPLHCSAKYGRLHTARFLVEDSIRLFLKTRKQVLYRVVQELWEMTIPDYLLGDIYEFLYTPQDPLLVVTSYGKTALDIARESGSTSVFAYLEERQLRCGLLGGPQVVARKSLELIFSAAVSDVIMGYAYDATYYNPRAGWRVYDEFFRNVSFANTDLVELTLKTCGKSRRLLEARDENGWTALHVAAFRGMFSMCEVLLRSGASLKARSFNWTAYDSAVANKMMNVANLLKNWGKPVTPWRNNRILANGQKNENRKTKEKNGKRSNAIINKHIVDKRGGRSRKKGRPACNKERSNQRSSNNVVAKKKVGRTSKRRTGDPSIRKKNNNSKAINQGLKKFPKKKNQTHKIKKKTRSQEVEKKNSSRDVEKNKQSNKKLGSEGVKEKSGRRARRGNKPRAKWSRNNTRGRRNKLSDQPAGGCHYRRGRRNRLSQKPFEVGHEGKAISSLLNPLAKEFKPSSYQLG